MARKKTVTLNTDDVEAFLNRLPEDILRGLQKAIRESLGLPDPAIFEAAVDLLPDVAAFEAALRRKTN